MSILLIVAGSLQRVEIAGLETVINSFVETLPPADRGASVVLFPEKLKFDLSPFGERAAYDAEIGLERNQAVWRPFLHRHFAEIIVFGLDRLIDFEEIVLACYLEGQKKSYLDRQGMHDLALWQEQVKPSLLPREVRMRRLGADRTNEYFTTIHRWLVAEITRAGFKPPVPLGKRSPDLSIYEYPRLAVDLAQHTDDLQRENHGASFSVLMCRDGSLVHTSDFYRAIANFVLSIDGIESVLDVGCGSGFLACHLAAARRYKDVLGIDSSAYRINGARLYAELNDCSARFDVMSVTNIRLPDDSVDLSVTSFALEQTGDELERCFAEIVRVTRKLIVLFEPSAEFFATLASQWHLPANGWANQYHAVLTRSGMAFATRPTLLYHYFNPGTVFVIDLESREHPRLRYPGLFGTGYEDWPGGARFI